MKYKLQDFRLIKTFFQLTKYWKGTLAQKRIKLSHQFWTKPHSKCDCNLIPIRDSFILSWNNSIYTATRCIGPRINFCITRRGGSHFARERGWGDPNHTTAQSFWHSLYNTHCTIRTILPVLITACQSYPGGYKEMSSILADQYIATL